MTRECSFFPSNIRGCRGRARRSSDLNGTKWRGEPDEVM